MKTIKENQINEIEIKNSKFIALLFKIDNSNDVKDILDKVKTTYPSATHYCYAYITETNQKSSDDKEPTGTAGIPMLNVLQKNNLTNVLAITVRYFGGIKLGATNLVRAYTKSLTEVLNKTQIISLEKGLKIKIIINYDMQKHLDYLLKNYEIVEKTFQEQITYYIKIPKNSLKLFSQYNPSIIEEIYIEKK